MKRIAVFFLSVFCVVQGQAQVALTPATPAISPAPVFVPGSPALTPAPANTGFVTTNTSLVALSAGLLSLQTNLEQVLPVLVLFNNNFDFVSLTDNGIAAAQSANPPGNFGANHATSFGANFGVNAAMPTGPSSVNSAANVQMAPSAAAGLPQGFTLPVTRDTLRALLALQSDMQRMLSLVNAVNAGAANSPGSFTNLFGVVPVSR